MSTYSKYLISKISLEDESELNELLKVQEEQENGDIFDETYMKLKQEQLVETKKDNDTDKQEAASEDSAPAEDSNDKEGDNDESNSDEKGDDSSDSGDSSSDDKSGSDDILGDLGDLDIGGSDDNKDDKSDDKKEDDKSKDEDKKDDKDDKSDDKSDDKKDDDKDKDKKDDKDDEMSLDGLDDILKGPSNESYSEEFNRYVDTLWYRKYNNEYLPIRENSRMLTKRRIDLESFRIGEGYTVNFGEGNYIDKVSVEELFEEHDQAMGEAAAMSLCIKDVLTYLGGHNRYSFEDLRDLPRGNYGLELFEEGTISGAAANAAGEGLKYLGKLGFEYGAIALRHIGRGVVVLLDRTLKGLYQGTQLLIKYLKDRPEQFKNSRALLTKAGEIAKEVQINIQGKKIKPQGPYENNKIIDKLKINGKLLALDNSRIAFEMAKSFYDHFLPNVINCTKAISNIINMVKTNLGKKADGAKMFSTPVFADFIAKDIPGYPVSEGLQSLVYKDILPGDLLLTAHIPARMDVGDSQEKLEKATEIYKNTSIFLAINKATYQKNAGGKYLPSIDDVIEYIDLLKDMTDYSLQCQSKLDDYNKLRDNIKNELKDYTNSIFKSEEEVTVQNSLIEYFTPNLSMLDNLSTKGVYVVDQYLKTHIAAGIEYINDCLKDGFELVPGQEDASPDMGSSTDSSSTEEPSSETSESSTEESSSDEETKPTEGA